MFGILIPGEIPIVQGPDPETEVTIWGSSCVEGRQFRPLPEPPPLQLLVWQTNTPVAGMLASSSWSRKIKLPTCKPEMLPLLKLLIVMFVLPRLYPLVQLASLL